MSDDEEQVISFAIHTQHAPNVQCVVMVPIDLSGPMRLWNYRRCGETASAAIIKPAGEGLNHYLMYTYCQRHFDMK